MNSKISTFTMVLPFNITTGYAYVYCIKDFKNIPQKPWKCPAVIDISRAAIFQLKDSTRRRLANRSKKLKENEYNSLGEASGHKEEFLNAWPDISFASFETGLENIERATEGDGISVKCSIHHGEANPEYFSVELFYMPDEKSYAVTNLELENLKDGKALNDKRPFR